jgi:hypothetical protein
MMDIPIHESALLSTHTQNLAHSWQKRLSEERLTFME